MNLLHSWNVNAPTNGTNSAAAIRRKAPSICSQRRYKIWHPLDCRRRRHNHCGPRIITFEPWFLPKPATTTTTTIRLPNYYSAMIGTIIIIHYPVQTTFPFNPLPFRSIIIIISSNHPWPFRPTKQRLIQICKKMHKQYNLSSFEPIGLSQWLFIITILFFRRPSSSSSFAGWKY